MRPTPKLVLPLLTGLALLGPAAGSALAANETLFLDSREAQAPGDNYAGPAVGTQTLVQGKQYRIVVTGAISLWARFQWTSPTWTVCGTPLAAAPFASPASPGPGPVGVDAEGRFALVQKPGPCPAPFGDPNQNFQVSLDGGDKWSDPLPAAGAPEDGNHRYVYRVVGRGKAPQFRFFDPAARDNYGRFRIRINGASGE
jgi:hypothetical protein